MESFETKSINAAKEARKKYVDLLKTCSPNYNGDTWASVQELDEARGNWIKAIKNNS